MKILTVDDEISWCYAVKDVFEPLGHKVDISLDTEEGLKKLIRENFDVVILDKNVPAEDDSFEMLKEIERLKSNSKYLSHFKFLKIIMLTAYSSIPSVKNALKLSAYDYIEKDNDFNENLQKNIREISLIKKLNLLSARQEEISPIFHIPSIQKYLDKLAFSFVTKDSFLYSIFAVNILFRINHLNKSMLRSLISKTGILNEIPELFNLEDKDFNFLHFIGAEIIKESQSEDLKCLYNLITDLFEKPNDLVSYKIEKVNQWYQIHRLLSYLEILIDEINNEPFLIKLRNYLSNRRKKINIPFADFVEDNYAEWVKQSIDKRMSQETILSPKIIDEYITPLLERPTFIIIFDGMRLDQWMVIKDTISEDLPGYRMKEELYLSILPTTTTYSRNSFLSGLFPSEIARKYNDGYLKTNAYEKRFLSTHKSLNGISFSYLHRAGQNEERLSSLIKYDKSPLKVLIFNFVDDLVHVMDKIGAKDYDFRKHIQASFKQSVMENTLVEIAQTGANIVITTDHGNIRVSENVKLGNYLSIDSKHSRYALVDKKIRGKKDNTLTVLKPLDFGLPDRGNQNYVFAKGNIRFLTKTKSEESEFVHGGVSMEEMIIPIILLEPF